MAKNIKNNFWAFFQEISKIPRESENEKGIADYIENFAKERNLKYVRDELHNIVIYKDATDEARKDEVIALQGHQDMVCQKTKESKHNFLTDPIEIIKEKDILKALDTTLGADNGMGVSFMLSILDSKDIKHPNLECIFTVQEETSMKGALNLPFDKIKTKRIISLDNEEDDKICIGSMGIREYNAERKVTETSISGKDVYELEFYNFKGGHSGIDIKDKTRTNTNKLLANTLRDLNVYLIDINGGTKANAIPYETKAIFAIDSENVSKLKDRIEELKNSNLYGKMKFVKLDNNYSKAITKEDSKEVIDCILEYRNGVLEQNSDGALLTSNFGVMSRKGDVIEIIVSFRNKVVSLAENFTAEMKELYNKHGFKLTYIDEYPAYETKGTNDLIEKSAAIYEKMFGKKVTVESVEGALECGAFAFNIEGVEFIAIGPNIHNAHSVDEYVEIESANNMYKYTIELLENL